MWDDIGKIDKAGVEPGSTMDGSKGQAFVPLTDIYETEEGMTLVLELPGVDREHIDININNNILSVKGTMPLLDGEPVAPVVREFETGDYHRRFTLSEFIDPAGIKASFKNGVLRVMLPKKTPPQPHNIEIEDR